MKRRMDGVRHLTRDDANIGQFTGSSAAAGVSLGGMPRARLRIIGGLSLCVLLGALACQRSEVPMESTATVSQAVEQDVTELVLMHPVGMSPTAAVLLGTDSVDIADRAKILGDAGIVAALGGQGVRIGSEASAPNVWSGTGAMLSDRSRVTGKVSTAIPAQVGNSVVWSGVNQVRTAAATFATEKLQIKFGACENAVRLEPGTTRGIAPGYYGEVSVKSRATLRLTGGRYTFKSLFVEPGGRIEVVGDRGALRLVVRESVTLRGPIALPASGRAVELVTAGSDVLLDVPFDGVVIAPKARLAMNSTAGAYQGTFVGRSVYVAPGVQVSLQAKRPLDSFLFDPPAPSSDQLTMPTTAGAPPNLLDSTRAASLRATDFITWAQESTESDAPAARSALEDAYSYAEVVTSLVDETRAAMTARNYSRSLVGLEVLTELDVPESEALFTELLDKSAEPGGEVNPETGLTPDAELLQAYQVKAAFGLGWIRSATAKARLKQAALSHPDPAVQRQAIRAYTLYFGDVGKAELRPQLAAGEQIQLDRFETFNLSASEYAAAQAAYLAKHPELVVAFRPFKTQNPNQTCNVE